MLKIQAMIICSLAVLAMLACRGQDSTSEKIDTHEKPQQAGVVPITTEQLQLMNIQTDTVHTRQLEGFFSAPARVQAIPTHIADIGTLIPGRVKEIYVAEGERVQKGQVLLEIQGLEIGEIKGEYMRSRAALESAKANFERQKKLQQENISSQRAFIEAQASYEEAKAAFSAADQKLHSIGISDHEAESLIAFATRANGQSSHGSEMAALKITSPISGVVGRTALKVGQLAQPETDIMEVVDSERVWVVADIYEKDLQKIKSQQRVEVLTEAFPGLVLKGKLEYMSPVVNVETRTVKVRTTIDNRGGYLKPEMFATMRIFDESSRHSLVVPEEAVQNDGEVDFVFVQMEEGAHARSDGEAGALVEETGDWKFKKTPVQTGIRQEGLVQIIAGLRGNERIVTKGAFFLKSEMMKESFGGHGH